MGMDDARSPEKQVLKLNDLIIEARRLVPVVKERAVEAQNLRQIPEETMADFRVAGFCRHYTPKRFGGLELDWGAHTTLAEEIARGCASSAWMVAVVLSHSWIVARFSEVAQRAVFEPDPDVVIASAFAGEGEMTKVEGGYHVNGKWAFASGVHHASWTIIGAQVPTAKTLTPNVRPPYRMALLRADQYEIIDDWYSEGLKGTGSSSLKATDQFVPEELTMLSDDMTRCSPVGALLHDSYIYGVELVPYLESSFVGPLIGAAKGALADYLEITKARRGREFGEKVSSQNSVQARVAESIMDIRTADRLTKDVMEGLHQDGIAKRAVVGERWVMQRLTFTYAARLCVQAVDRLVSMMGATGQIGNNPVQRQFRDIRAIAAHTSFIWDKAAIPVGKWALGLQTGDPSVDDSEDVFKI
ncbi:MAG: acyl-CoA dehydrogenase family protein [Rhodospirillaceae bacterium]